MYVGAFPAVSNRATFRQSFQVNDGETGDLIDLSQAAITFEIRERRNKRSALGATVAGGAIAVTGAGTFDVTFTAAQMRSLGAGEYDVGCVIGIGGDEEQFIIGSLPVLDGVVS